MVYYNGVFIPEIEVCGKRKIKKENIEKKSFEDEALELIKTKQVNSKTINYYCLISKNIQLNSGEFLYYSAAPKEYIEDELCSKIASFIEKDGKYYHLWSHNRLARYKKLKCWNEDFVKGKLNNYLTNVKLILGEIEFLRNYYVAWKVVSDEGIFYILWRSGSICEDQKNFVFEEKAFEDMKVKHARMFIAYDRVESKGYFL